MYKTCKQRNGNCETIDSKGALAKLQWAKILVLISEVGRRNGNLTKYK